jgi:probable HAF family extracellular repeat protein
MHDRLGALGGTLRVESAPGRGLRAFLWTDGQMMDLGTLGGGSAAIAINDLSVVVGNSTTGAGVTHAFLWSNG